MFENCFLRIYAAKWDVHIAGMNFKHAPTANNLNIHSSASLHKALPLKSRERLLFLNFYLFFLTLLVLLPFLCYGESNTKEA
ncbi:MAG: DUF6783 domain-containing protein [Kineothrix sp.]